MGNAPGLEKLCYSLQGFDQMLPKQLTATLLNHQQPIYGNNCAIGCAKTKMFFNLSLQFSSWIERIFRKAIVTFDN